MLDRNSVSSKGHQFSSGQYNNTRKGVRRSSTISAQGTFVSQPQYAPNERIKYCGQNTRGTWTNTARRIPQRRFGTRLYGYIGSRGHELNPGKSAQKYFR